MKKTKNLLRNLLNGLLNTVSRHKIGTIIRKDNNRWSIWLVKILKLKLKLKL